MSVVTQPALLSFGRVLVGTSAVEGRKKQVKVGWRGRDRWQGSTGAGTGCCSVNVAAQEASNKKQGRALFKGDNARR